MPRTIVVAALLACVLMAGVLSRVHAAANDGHLRTDDGDTVHVTPEIRRAGLRFSPEVSPGDRAWILAAIATARPEAQRLVHEVDGMVTITTAGTGQMMGLTQPLPDGFRVWFNVARLNDSRVVDRDTTVLHELGHVIDFALIPDALDRTLDDGIPRGGNCDQQDGVLYGNCAPGPERIADTFAKWALGGSVSALGAGYTISMPPSLDAWGAPLAALAGSLPD